MVAQLSESCDAGELGYWFCFWPSYDFISVVLEIVFLAIAIPLAIRFLNVRKAMRITSLVEDKAPNVEFSIYSMTWVADYESMQLGAEEFQWTHGYREATHRIAVAQLARIEGNYIILCNNLRAFDRELDFAKRQLDALRHRVEILVNYLDEEQIKKSVSIIEHFDFAIGALDRASAKWNSGDTLDKEQLFYIITSVQDGHGEGAEGPINSLLFVHGNVLAKLLVNREGPHIATVLSSMDRTLPPRNKFLRREYTQGRRKPVSIPFDFVVETD
ncbi:hypothetical protein [Jannaschia sp. AI_61]|nr:hypothetical protein [Jannaschia sp. AI_61]